MSVDWKKIIIALAAMFLTGTAYAESLQSLSKIEQAAYVYALTNAQTRYDNPQITVEPMDSRLRLQQCAMPLETFANNRNGLSGSRTIGVKCNSPVAWTVYVPVKLKVMRPVVVAAHALSANQVLIRTDIKIEQMDIASLRQGYHQRTKNVIGQQLKYPLSMGMIIQAGSLKAQKIVQRGEQIILVAKAGQMEVRMSGTALSDASLGELVKVKNLTSKRVVEGVVDSPGIVMVTM